MTFSPQQAGDPPKFRISTKPPCRQRSAMQRYCSRAALKAALRQRPHTAAGFPSVFRLGHICSRYAPLTSPVHAVYPSKAPSHRILPQLCFAQCQRQAPPQSFRPGERQPAPPRMPAAQWELLSVLRRTPSFGARYQNHSACPETKACPRSIPQFCRKGQSTAILPLHRAGCAC